MALGPDSRNALIALNRFGLGARGGRSDLARAASDPRGFLKAELLRPVAGNDGGAPLPDTKSALQALYADQAQRKMERRAAAAMSPPASSQPAASGDGRSAHAMADAPQDAAGQSVAGEVMQSPRPAAKPRPGQVPAARRLFRAEAMARFRAAGLAEAGFAERLVHFWSNHFCVSTVKGPVVRVTAGSFEREAIRPHVLGRFSDMLLAVETHPAMLFYLDNVHSLGPQSIAGRNRQRGLNENLAREILELHTVGVDEGYTQADVTSLARILTGWTFLGPQQGRLGEPGTFLFLARAHEPGAETLLGKEYPAGAMEQGKESLLDLARHPATAQHIARKFAAHFVADDPPLPLVERLRNVFINTGGDLKALAIGLVESDEAWGEAASKLRMPEEFLLAALRAINHLPDEPGPLLSALTMMGQPLWQPPGPNGWPDAAAAWVSPEGIKARLDVSATMAARANETIDPNDLLLTVAGDAASPETRQAVARAESRQQGLALLFMAPEFQRR